MEDITFNLKHSIFHKDLYDYKNKPLLAIHKFLNCRNVNIKRPLNLNPYCSQDERPYKCNDKYNKIILALRYNRNINQVSDHNPIDLPEHYHKFLVHISDIDKEIREGIDDIVSDYCKIKEPSHFNRSDKKPKILGRRKIERALADYIESLLIDIKTYYDEEINKSKNKKKQLVKDKLYEPFACECGYIGLYANKNRHIKTKLHLKKLINKLDTE